MNNNVRIELFEDRYLEEFIRMNQNAFKNGISVDYPISEGVEIISRQTIIDSIKEGIAYRILDNDEFVGGIIITLNKKDDKYIGEIDILFVDVKCHSKNVGYSAWKLIEEKYNDVDVWYTLTPAFEERNVHFYVNKCGFKIIEYFNKYHPDPNGFYDSVEDSDDGLMDGMFKFEKITNNR